MRNMRYARFAAFLAIFATLIALSACRIPSGNPAQAEIQALLNTRADAVNAADQQKYISTVLPSDKVLLKEETNLIRAASGLGVKDYKAELGKISEKQDGGYSAQVTQSYTAGGQARGCSFQALFRSENGKLYYDGPDFFIKQNNHIKVYYEGESDASLAQQLLNEETNTLVAMKEQLSFEPTETVSIKLFDDQQVFLQSVKLDLPSWVGGWHEYGEAVKSFTGAFGSDGANYQSMLNHETTHLMVSELSNDNASYWLQEGMAGVYEEKLSDPNAPKLADRNPVTPYAEQKKIDLEKLGSDDQDAVSKYYASSKAYAAFMIDQFGWDKVRQMLEYMKKFEMIPVTAAEKIPETNDRTDEAIAAVLGLKTDKDFQAAFDKWLTGIGQN